MAKISFRLPDIGEGVGEGEVVRWLVQVGDAVREDQDLLEVSTDKATVTIASPATARVEDIRVEEGQTARVGDVLVVLSAEAAGDSNAASRLSQQPAEQSAASAVGDLADALPGVRLLEQMDARRPASPKATRASSVEEGDKVSSLDLCLPHGNPADEILSQRSDEWGLVSEFDRSTVHMRGSRPGTGGSAPGQPRGMPIASGRLLSPSSSQDGPASAPEVAQPHRDTRPLATPATRRLARRMGLALNAIRGTGPRGRITQRDLRSALRQGGENQDVASAPAMAATVHGDHAPNEAAFAPTMRTQRLRGVRRTIAQRMALTCREAALFTFVEEFRADRLVALQRQLAPDAQKEGLRLTYLPFVVKAVLQALGRHPHLNATWDRDRQELLLHRDIHLGLAVAAPQGLLVPVIRNAARLDLLALGHHIVALSQGARAGKLRPEALRGSTFTVTSLGKQSGLLATPITNYPEVAILGLHRIRERPVVDRGEVVVGQVATMSLSFDHRFIDGHVAAAFAYDLIALLERPEILLLHG